jgi:hypothetical protein
MGCLISSSQKVPQNMQYCEYLCYARFSCMQLYVNNLGDLDDCDLKERAYIYFHQCRIYLIFSVKCTECFKHPLSDLPHIF